MLVPRPKGEGPNGGYRQRDYEADISPCVAALAVFAVFGDLGGASCFFVGLGVGVGFGLGGGGVDSDFVLVVVVLVEGAAAAYLDAAGVHRQRREHLCWVLRSSGGWNKVD